MQVYLDFSFFEQLSAMSGPQIMWELFVNGGWVLIVFVWLQFLWVVWLNARQGKFAGKVNYILLAIDVPRDNEQSPKAVEHMMTNLAGAHMPLSKWEEWWDGAHQLSFSLEIVSLEGYIQFLIRTPDFWRDMVEAAVYAQYPEAEINEVEDYVTEIPDVYPNDTHNFYGSEMVPVKHEAYPLRSYIEFEHSLTQELKDPLAALLEMFSRLGRGEQMWFQIIVMPTDDSWKDDAQKVVDEMIGKKSSKKSGGFFGAVAEFFRLWAVDAADSLFATGPAEAKKEDKSDNMLSEILYMSPGARRTVELVEYKMAKLGFYCKIRMAYVAQHAFYKKQARVGTLFSVIKQYNTLNANALKPSKEATTKALYLFAKQRVIAKQNKFMAAYKGRSAWRGMQKFILNIEELATLYHFPAINIKAPLLKKTSAKKAEPPSALPVGDEEFVSSRRSEVASGWAGAKEEREIAEPNQRLDDPKIAYLPKSLQEYDFDNNYYEQKFGIKTATKNDVSEAKRSAESTQDLSATPPPNLPFVE
ncbi:MAG: hypothetical protein NUV82_02025 [Candidatus Komeilibacteria bacterium]|nr:hypothetical protein [Candidatus Komeilibacteria bacterium]